jgi:hypothetical protein
MAEKVKILGLRKEAGYLYFIDKAGDISRIKMARGRKKLSESEKAGEKVVQAGITREPGYLYFIDKEGDVSRAKMARGRKKVG